jgi:diacylglycerol kinase family enzyme
LGAQKAKAWSSVSKLLAILNPCSGQFKSSGFEKRWLPQLRDLVDDVVFTDAEGTATRIASDSTDYDGFVVVGGDGTILEVIVGMQRERQHLAAIPTGRGNCLARDLGIKTVADGLTGLKSGGDTRIDLMQADINFKDGSHRSSLSASTIALGYVVNVVERASNFRAAGPYGYAIATLLTPPHSFRCRLGTSSRNDEDRTCTGIVINNTINLANFPAFKKADLHDGLVDLLLLEAGWWGQTLHNLSILSALGFHEPGDRSQATDVRVSLDAPLTLMIDGQLFADAMSLRVQCLPAALSCRRLAAS